MVLGWTKHGDGKHLAPGEVVRPDERLSWPRMVGFGAQHVIAMFGASFVFPLVMGLDPNTETPGRLILREKAATLVKSMQTALSAGDPSAAQLVAAASRRGSSRVMVLMGQPPHEL